MGIPKSHQDPMFILLPMVLVLVSNHGISRIKNSPKWRVPILRIMNLNIGLNGLLCSVGLNFIDYRELCTNIITLFIVPVSFMLFFIQLMLLSKFNQKQTIISSVFIGLLSSYLSCTVFPRNQELEWNLFVAVMMLICFSCWFLAYTSIRQKIPHVVKIWVGLKTLFYLLRLVAFFCLTVTQKKQNEGFLMLYFMCCLRLCLFFVFGINEQWDPLFSRADMKQTMKLKWNELKKQIKKDGIIEFAEFIEDYDLIKSKNVDLNARCCSVADLFANYIDKNAKNRLKVNEHYLEFIQRYFDQKTLCLADFDTLHEQCLIKIYQKSFPKYFCQNELF